LAVELTAGNGIYTFRAVWQAQVLVFAFFSAGGGSAFSEKASGEEAVEGETKRFRWGFVLPGIMIGASRI